MTPHESFVQEDLWVAQTNSFLSYWSLLHSLLGNKPPTLGAHGPPAEIRRLRSPHIHLQPQLTLEHPWQPSLEDSPSNHCVFLLPQINCESLLKRPHTQPCWRFTVWDNSQVLLLGFVKIFWCFQKVPYARFVWNLLDHLETRDYSQSSVHHCYKQPKAHQHPFSQWSVPPRCEGKRGVMSLD